MRNAKGKLAIFEHPDDLIDAVKKIRALHVTKFDAYTPFAVHGLDHAMNLKRSWIPWATLFMALTGGSLGFFFETWTMSIDWQPNIGGKPFIGWPAFIPVTFESTILISGVTTACIILALCWPFDFWRASRHPRLTNDQFGLFIDRRDAQFDETVLTKIFKETHAIEIQTID